MEGRMRGGGGGGDDDDDALRWPMVVTLASIK
jgi:hypothetical protein